MNVDEDGYGDKNPVESENEKSKISKINNLPSDANSEKLEDADLQSNKSSNDEV